MYLVFISTGMFMIFHVKFVLTKVGRTFMHEVKMYFSEGLWKLQLKSVMYKTMCWCILIIFTEIVQVKFETIFKETSLTMCQ